MKTCRLILMWVLTVFILAPPVLAQSDSLHFSTFYPAPFGAYDRIRLVPRDTLTGPCDIGTMYTDNAGNLHFCSTGNWDAVESNPIGIWVQNGTDIFPRDGTGPNVGIGTTTPTEKLHVDGGNARFEQNVTVIGNTLVNSSIGVGTSLPAYRLDVAGDGKVNDLYLRSDGTNTGRLQVQYVSGAYYATYAP